MDLSDLKQVVLERGADWSSLYFAVGDLHGRSDIAIKVIEILEVLDTRNVVFLGDYIDRQSDPLGTVRAVHQAKLRNPSWQMIQGNHERCALDAFEGGIALDEENSIFKICTAEEIAECCRIFYSLPVYHETEHLIFMHGGIDESFDKPISDVPKQEMLWTYIVNPMYRRNKIVHGHTVYNLPTESSTDIATQTLAWAGNAIPFCISVIRDTPDEQKLLGWIEVHLDGSNQIDFVFNDSIFKEGEKVCA